MGGLRWTHKSTRKLAWALRRRGFRVSYVTVARLLRAQRYSLRANRLPVRPTALRPPGAAQTARAKRTGPQQTRSRVDKRCRYDGGGSAAFAAVAV